MEFVISVFSENPGVAIERAVIVAVPGKGTTVPRKEVRTDEQGEARLVLPPNSQGKYYFTVSAPGHMPVAFEHLPDEEPSVILKRLPAALDRLGWWHNLLGLSAYDPNLGSGIHIGVIDSGFAQHPALAHVKDKGSFVHSEHCPELPGIDREGHGTAVIGLFGARPSHSTVFAGIAPGAAVVSVKVSNWKRENPRVSSAKSSPC